MVRLLQLGAILPEALEHKYKNDIFANEFMLLSYYIASINIEQVYHQVRTQQGVDEGYVEFPSMTLTDTFQLHEADGTITEDFEGRAANNERAKAEKDSAITVIVMNPPYSSGQNSANDNNQNLAYPRLDARIANTYADRPACTTTRKTKQNPRQRRSEKKFLTQPTKDVSEYRL